MQNSVYFTKTTFLIAKNIFKFDKNKLFMDELFADELKQRHICGLRFLMEITRSYNKKKQLKN